MLAGCAATPQTRQLADQPPARLQPVKLLGDVPFHAQRAYQCGPASLAMALNHSGVDIRPDDLVADVYVPDRQGAFQVEMLAAARRHNRLALVIDPHLAHLLAWVDAGQPVLVLQNLGLDWYPKWHYAVVIGYDLAARTITLHSGETANYTVSMGLFERTWQRADHWGMATLAPGELPVKVSPHAYLRAAAAFEETRPGSHAERVWRTGADAWPEVPDLTMGLANHLYGNGRPDDAGNLYRKLLEKHPDYLPAYNNLASLLMERGDLDRAIAIARDGLSKAGGKHPFLEKTLADALARSSGEPDSP